MLSVTRLFPLLGRESLGTKNEPRSPRMAAQRHEIQVKSKHTTYTLLLHQKDKIVKSFEFGVGETWIILNNFVINSF